jgi:DNA-binding XRE family transcriptional regulator
MILPELEGTTHPRSPISPKICQVLLIVCRPEVSKQTQSTGMNDQIRSVFGANVRRCRTSRKLSQERFADLAGLHRTYIGSVERGERNVSLDNIVGIARALRVPPTQLLEGIK